MLRQCFGKGVVVRYEYQRAVSETAVREGIQDSDNTCIDNMLPTLNRTYGNLTRQPET